jgi:glycosyltransferase involved in cell wall biosynthesis
MNVGGPARHVLHVAAELGDADVAVAAGRPPAEEGELSDPRVPVRSLPLVRPVDPTADLRSLAAVRALLTGSPVDVLHTHMAKAGTVGRLAARTVRQRPRTVHTFHGHVLDGYFRPTLTRAIVESERRLASSTDVLVAVSGEIRDELLALGIGRAEQYRLIAPGVDLDPYLAVERPDGALRGRLGLDHDVPLVGILGRLAPVKAHEVLLEALAQLDGVHLAVLGDGERRAELLELAARLGIASRTHLLGWWDDVPGALADLDVVALSSWAEGTPVALIEASAAGRPVVATRVGGVPAVVEDGVTGLLVEAGDAAEMARALDEVLRAEGRGAAMGRAGREHVRRRFDATEAVLALGALYRELTGS